MGRKQRLLVAASIMTILVTSSQGVELKVNGQLGNANVGVSVDPGEVVVGVGVNQRGSVNVYDGINPSLNTQQQLQLNLNLQLPRIMPPDVKIDTPGDLLALGEGTIRLLVGNLADSDRVLLKLRCREVLTDPAGFDEALVALCRIVLSLN